MAAEVDNVLLKAQFNQGAVGNLNLAGVSRSLTFFVEWPADSTAGAVQIEEAYIPEGNDKTVNSYSGTFAPIGAAFTSPSSSQQMQTLTVSQRPFSVIQARVTVTVNGATGVTVRVIGN